jgi:hypothetical protein
MSLSARLFAAAIATAALAAAVVGMLMIAHPVSAQSPRTAVCSQVTAGIALDPRQVTQLMNQLLAGGKTDVVMVGSTLCAY